MPDATAEEFDLIGDEGEATVTDVDASRNDGYANDGRDFSDILDAPDDASSGDDDAKPAVEIADGSIDDAEAFDTSPDTGSSADSCASPQGSWLPSIAPAECPELAPLCEGRVLPGVMTAQLPNLPTALLPNLSASAWSQWRPQRLETTGEGDVKLTAIWINQLWVLNDGVSIPPKYLAGMVKPSLLPTACVTVLLKPSIAADAPGLTVAGYAIWPFPPSDLMPVSSGQTIAAVATDLKCPPKPGDNFDWNASVTLTLAGGTIVSAHPGRASSHLLADAMADISHLVRDLSSGPLAVGPVLEVLPPGEATATGIDLDVSVCRATPAILAASELACPTEPWPPADSTPTSVPWFRVDAGPFKRTLTADFLGKIEAPGWSGVGIPKFTGGIDGPHPSMGSWCCYDCAPSDADWLCAGWQETTQATNTLAQWTLTRPLLVRATGAFAGPDWPVNLPLSLTVIDGWAQGPMPKNGFGAVSAFELIDVLGPRDLPARQRDGAWERIRMGLPGQYSVAGVGGTLLITGYGPSSSQFVWSDAPFVACRRHFVPKVGPDGNLLPGCVFVKGKLTADLAVTKPGKPLPPAKPP